MNQIGHTSQQQNIEEKTWENTAACENTQSNWHITPDFQTFSFLSLESVVDIGIVVKVGQWVQVLLWRSLVRAFIDRTGIAIPTNGRDNNDTTWYFVFFSVKWQKR